MGATVIPQGVSGTGAIVCVGTTQAGATPLPAGSSLNLTTAAGQVAAILPAGGAAPITVYVPGATSATIFPPVGGKIMAGAVDASLAVATTKVATFHPVGPLDWAVNLTA